MMELSPLSDHDLKPCPFCNGKARFSSMSPNGDYFMVSCLACSVQTGIFEAQSAALKEWNFRSMETDLTCALATAMIHLKKYFSLAPCNCSGSAHSTGCQRVQVFNNLLQFQALLETATSKDK